MHARNPSRLLIEQPYDSSRPPQSAYSPAGGFYSSPASYNPLPFTQQMSFGSFVATNAAGPRSPYQHNGAAVEVMPMTLGGAHMGLGLSQREAPSMLRASSASTNSSSSSFAPSSPFHSPYAHHSFPLSSPVLFSPSPSDPYPPGSQWIDHSSNLNRHRNDFDPSPDPSHSALVSFPKKNSHRRGNSSVSFRTDRGSAERQIQSSRRGVRDSVNKPSLPVGIGTRPDEEVKPRRKVVVKMPRERDDACLGDAVEEDDNLGVQELKRISRSPLSSEEKRLAEERIERDCDSVLEEDELVARPRHFDEIKPETLPPTIDVYLPSRSSWNLAGIESVDDHDAIPSTLTAAGSEHLAARSDPRTSAVIPESGRRLTPSSTQKHSRAYSLFNSPVTLPPRLQNVLDSLSRRPATRHSPSMSLSTPSRALDAAAAPFLLPDTPGPSTVASGIASRLTPYAPSFSMPTWSAIIARGQGTPLPESDESMEEQENSQLEEPSEKRSQPTISLSGVARKEATLEKESLDPERQAGNRDSRLEVETAHEGGDRSVREISIVPGQEEDQEPGGFDGPRFTTRKESLDSTVSDHTGVASDENFTDEGQIEQTTKVDDDRPALLVDSPASLDSCSSGTQDRALPLASRTTSPTTSVIARAEQHKPDAESRGEGSAETIDVGMARPSQETAVDAKQEDARRDAQEINAAFEFPARSPQKVTATTDATRESESPTPSCAAVDLSRSSLLPGRRDDSPLSSPTMFGLHGGPGSIVASSLPASPPFEALDALSGTIALEVQNPTPSRPSSRASLAQGVTPTHHQGPPVPILSPIPTRPGINFQSALEEASLEIEQREIDQATSLVPLQALPPQQAPSPRKVSHGPLPPIPLVHVETSKRIDKGVGDSHASRVDNSELAPPYRPRGRQESEDIALPSSARPRHRALPVPPTQSPETVPEWTERLHESSAASEVSSAYETGSIAHNEEAVSDTGHDDDTPLRILERIIENQFDRLRQDLKASAARSVDTQPLPSLVDDRLQTLLSATIDKFASQLLSSLAPEFVSLADGQQAVARTVRQSQDETRALKAAFAQLDLDIASRQDAAYAAFGERLDPVGAVQSRDSTRAGPLEEVDDSHKAASENEVQRLKAELNVAKGEISALEKRLASRDERLENVLAAKAAQQQLLASANRTNLQLRNALEEAHDRIAHLEGTERAIRSRLDSAQAEKDVLIDENNGYKLKLAQVEASLFKMKDAVVEEIETSKSLVDTLTAERDRLQAEKRHWFGNAHRRPRDIASVYSSMPPIDALFDMPSTPPRSRLLSAGSDPSTSSPSKLDELGCSDDDSDDTVAHTNVSRSASVRSQFLRDDEGWYSPA